MSLAATVIASLAPAGLNPEASEALFPAATTTGMPRLNNCTKGQALKVSFRERLTFVTALSSAVSMPSTPMLMETTLGRPVDGAVVATHSIPEILNTTVKENRNC
jgi:hypothetical protein